MPSTRMYFKDRDTSKRLTIFLIVVAIISAALAIVLEKKKHEEKNQKIEVVK